MTIAVDLGRKATKQTNKQTKKKSANVRFYLSYDIKNTLKSHFWLKNVIMLSICTQHCYGRHYVSRKSINHKWFTDFIAWRYFTPRGDVI